MEPNLKIILVYTFAYEVKDPRGVIINNLGNRV